ncbi:T9SS type A sorting domain-containing protein [Flavihumibacter fluvii]|uniref:T9SS type A sorting domain-containing protein n=1 Tax=Flavihumibacter fluvii TaxID=2838157 RepID=UPI001BDEB8C2|nr:T9SS type A sorting domain-containing protein [Flavihumibacter fluvii]ULQ52824.1 T9SS type A sorting domain-containing protein [Flavihumibacter fluvii]
MKTFSTLLLCLFSIHALQAQTVNDYRSVGNVTLNSNTNWQRYWNPPGGPNINEWVNAVTAPNGFNFGDNNTITLEVGHTLNIAATANFSSNNDFTFVIRGTVTQSGAGTPYAIDYGNGNTLVRFENTGVVNYGNIFQNHNFSDLEFLATSGTFSPTFTSRIDVDDDLVLTNTVLTFNTTANNTTITLDDDVTLNNSTINFNFTGNNGFVDIGDDLTMTGSTINASFLSTANNTNDGDFNVNGIMSLTNSSFNLNGNYADLTQISGSDENITLNNSSINLNGDNQVFDIDESITTFSNNSSITLLGANGQLLLDNGETIAGNSTNYIHLSPTSTVSRQINVNTNFFFPIGTSTTYLPVTINSTNSGSNPVYTVGVFQGASTNAQPGGPSSYKPPIVDAIWTIQQDGVTPKDVTLTFEWQNGLEGTVFNGLGDAQVGIGSYNTASSSWSPAAAGTGDNSANTFTTNSISLLNATSNSFAIAQLSFSLPLLSRNFTAIPINGQVKLDWIGVATHSTAYFEVERSSTLNGKFAKLATIPVSAVGEAKYQYADASPIQPEGYYRIRIIDELNRVSYTKTLKVNLSGNYFTLNTIYPTVTTSQLNLLISSTRQKQVKVNVIDQQGRTVMVKNLTIGTGSQSYTLNVSQLAGGQYFLLLNSGAETINGRFIKQ